MTNSRLAPHEAAELARVARRARWRSRTCAGAPGSPAPSASPEAATASTSAKPSSTLVRPDSSTAVRLEPTTLRWCCDVGDLRGGARPAERTRAATARRARAVGLDEEGADGVAAGRLRDVRRVGDEERVGRRGGELLGHADVVERHGVEPLGAPVLQPQSQQVAGVQLEVLDGLGDDEHRVGLRGELRHQAARRCRPGTSASWSLPAAPIVRGPHAVEVLQVGADVGEAVLERLDAADARTPASRAGAAGPDVRAGRLGDRHVGAVGQPRVDLGLLLVGGVEDRGGAGERGGERDERDRAREQPPLAAHRRRDGRRRARRPAGAARAPAAPRPRASTRSASR